MPGARYGWPAVAFHWVIGLALLAQIAFGFLLDEIAPRGTPARTAMINLHKSFGLILAVVIVARLRGDCGMRRRRWPARCPSGTQRAATDRTPGALCLHAAHAGVGLRRVATSASTA